MTFKAQHRPAAAETQLRIPHFRQWAALAPITLLGLCSALVACESCKGGVQKGPEAAVSAGPPTLRLYLVTDLAGALEPCGCVKDQLGGLDHAAAFIHSEKPGAPSSALVSAGPLFFMDPSLREDRKAQEIAKAETLAGALKDLGLVAFAPGRNDWAAGQPELTTLGTTSGGSVLLSNVVATPPLWTGSMVREIGGIKVGFVGVAGLDDPAPLVGLTVSPAMDAVKREVVALKQQGAQVLIAIGAVGRGEAKRIADVAPDLTAILVGSTSQSGDVNTATPTPERVGDVLIAETGNHLQTVATLDLYVRGTDYTFQDGTGLDQAKKRDDLMRRIDDLRAKIATWEREGKVDQKDIDARKADVAKLEADKKALDTPPPPAEGSFFRYTITEVRESLGKDDAMQKQLAAYYKKVNEANKAAFASKLPPKPGPDEPGYAGVDSCVPCHAAPKAVWDKSRHKNAYTTLSSQFKEYNLDCVSCHVTGYDKPGGSTVTHVEKLDAVQCEVCHGPSSKHVANPKVPPPVPSPGPDTCPTCHHPPHVHTFDSAAKMADILGPGHGRPL